MCIASPYLARQTSRRNIDKLILAFNHATNLSINLDRLAHDHALNSARNEHTNMRLICKINGMREQFSLSQTRNYAAVHTIVLNGYKTIVSRLVCKQAYAEGGRNT